MKTFTCTLLLYAFLYCITASPSYSQFNLWEPDDGVKVRQGHHLLWVDGGVALDENGNRCITWSDARRGTYDIYIQLYDPDGNELWDEDGVIIAGGPWVEKTPEIIYMGNGEWIVGWLDMRNDNNNEGTSELYLQRVSQDQEILWNLTGIKVIDGNSRQRAFQLYPVDGDEFIITWSMFYWNQDVYAQKMDLTGNRLWGDEGISITGPAAEDYYDIKIDSDNNLLVTWAQHQQDLYRVRVNKFNSDGVGLLGDNGIIAAYSQEYQREPRIVGDLAGGAFVCWDDRNSDLIYGQHINANGVLQWGPDGDTLATYTDVWRSRPELVESDTLECILVWLSHDNSCFAQKIGSEPDSAILNWGEEGNELNGNPIFYDPGDHYRLFAFSDNSGGAVVYSGYFKVQRLSPDGARYWEEDCIIDPHSYNSDFHSYAGLVSGNEIVFIYRDNVPGEGGLYYNEINIEDGSHSYPDGSILLRESIDNSVRHKKLKSYGTTTYISWLDNRLNSLPYIQQFDIETGLTLFEDNGIPVINIELSEEPDTISVSHYDLDMIINSEGQSLISWCYGNQMHYGHIPAIQKIDADGTKMWGDWGIKINPLFHDLYSSDVENCRIIGIEDGSTLLIYDYYSTLTDWCRTVEIACLDTDGTVQWQIGEELGLEVGTYDVTLRETALLSDNSIVVIIKYHMDYNDCRPIQMIRVDSNGNTLWDEPLVLDDSSNYVYSTELLVRDDHILTFWNNYIYNSNSLRVQRIDYDGTFGFDDEGYMLPITHNGNFKIAEGKDGNFWMAWEYGPEIYYMLYDSDIQPLLEPAEGVQVQCPLPMNVNPVLQPDGDGGVYLFWENNENWVVHSLGYIHITEEGNYPLPEYDEGGILLATGNTSYYSSATAPDGTGGVIICWSDDRGSLIWAPRKDLYAMRINDGTVEINNVSDNRLLQPSDWELNSPYPNPFNPSTTINISIPRAGNIKLTVFDILGREVVSLANDYFEAGEYSINWYGSDNFGNTIASGTYFVNLKSNEVNLTRKLIVLK